MPKIKLNLKDVRPGMEPIPAGRYAIEVLDADIREGKESGQPYLWLHMKVADGDYSKRRLFFQGTLNQDSDGLGITFASINALFCEDLTGNEEPYELDSDDLIGLEAIAVVGIEPDLEGEDRNRVKYLRVLEGEAAEAVAVKKEESEDRPWD